MLPDGSRTAQSRVPQGCSIGSWTISASAATSLSKVGVEVVGVEVDAVEGALGDQRGDRLAVGGAAVQVVGEDDGDVRLGGGADGDPAEVAFGDVVALFEAERVAVERHGAVGVMDDYEAGGESEVHGRKAREQTPPAFLHSCSARGSAG